VTDVNIPSHWVKARVDVSQLTSFTGYTVTKVMLCRDNEGTGSPMHVCVTLAETLDAGQQAALIAALNSELNEITISVT
jgi:hypothetical protein